MQKILINAYACSPNMGSEPGMAWNWVSNLAKHCELHIITEGEFRDKIEAVVPTLEQGRNMHFYYNPVSEEIRKMCWNQGDWRFYKYYREWQWKTYIIAKDICRKENIDVLHQLNMIGFREPGYLWKLSKESGIPFVWGPIGGLKMFPLQYAESIKLKAFFWVKNIITKYQIRFDKRVNYAVNQASALISSIPDSYNAIKKYHNKESFIIPETGCSEIDGKSSLVNSKEEARFNRKNLRVLWVGKFDYRKRLDIAIHAVQKANKLISDVNSQIILEVCGTGNSEQQQWANAIANGDHNIHFLGQLSQTEIKQKMDTSDVFLFTSVNEDTSTVVLEALSSQLPVICFNACGMSAVIDENVGIKIPLSTPSKSIDDFSHALQKLNYVRDNLSRMSSQCNEKIRSLSWTSKIEQLMVIYEQITS